MSESGAVPANPFDVAALDEDTELTALANALRLADGFRLFFVRCNQPNQRLRLMAKLGLLLPEDTFFYVHLTEPVPHLLDALRERLPASPVRALFVSGLEYSLPIADEAENTSFIANLNASRNSFPSVLSCPLVLWLPEYALTAIVRGAPDFFSIRSGVYFFAASPKETAPLVNAVTAGDSWQFASFPLLEKQERIAVIENLLQDYKALSPHQRDYRAEAQLLERLAYLRQTLGHWNMAERAYQVALQIYRELGNRHGEGAMLGNLGNVYQDQGRWEAAKQMYQQDLRICRELGDRHGEGQTLNNLGIICRQQRRWIEAEQTYQAALQIYRELGEWVGEGQTLGNLGIVYQNQGRWIEAEQTYQSALQICRHLGNRHSEGAMLGNLGTVYQLQGRWVEAEQAYRQNLQICVELGNQHSEGMTLNNLGIVYQNQGRLTEAEQKYQQGLLIFRELGDTHGEGAALGNLALVKAAQGKFTEALEIGRPAIEILRSTEDVALLKSVEGRIEKWEREVQDVSHA